MSHFRISFWYLGKTRLLFRASRKLPHKDMEPRKEFNVHVFGYRFAITWGDL